MNTRRITRWSAVALAACLTLSACRTIPAPDTTAEPTAVPTAVAGVRPTTPVNRVAVIETGGTAYTVSPDGQDRAPLNTSGTIPTAALVWSPDSSRIAFSLVSGAGSELIVVDARGGNRVSTFAASRAEAPFYLFWSPDNQHIAFLMLDNETGIRLQVTGTTPGD